MLNYYTKSWLENHRFKVAFSLKNISEKDLDILKTMFHQLDEDGSGTLELDEIQTAMKACGMQNESDSVIQQFKKVDKANIGMINFEQFAILIFSSSRMYKLSEEQSGTEWTRVLTNFMEAIRRQKLESILNDQSVEESERCNALIDLFIIPDYIKSLRSTQDKRDLKELKTLRTVSYSKNMNNRNNLDYDTREFRDICKDALNNMRRENTIKPLPLLSKKRPTTASYVKKSVGRSRIDKTPPNMNQRPKSAFLPRIKHIN